MADREPFMLDIEKIVAGGEGLAFHEGRAVFVPFSLPGERVVVQLIEEKRDYAKAEIQEILVSSPDRVVPECPLFGICGGCNLQHASYSAQRIMKSVVVRDLFKRGAGFDPGELRIEAAEPYGYRNRVQFHFDRRGRLGFKRRGSGEVIAVPFCPIADPAVNAWLADHQAAARDELRPYVGNVDRFLVYGFGGKTWMEGRHHKVEIEVLGDKITFDPAGFFQSNLGMLGSLVESALDGIDGGMAADLYAGVGLFGHFLARRGARVVMVEREAKAMTEARGNVTGPIHRRYNLSVDEWCRGPGAESNFDFVVVDPPRSGLSAGLKAWMLRCRPPILSYVSCDPVTLARDAQQLVEGGFRLASLLLFDFYPQTSHVEALARFVDASAE